MIVPKHESGVGRTEKNSAMVSGGSAAFAASLTHHGYVLMRLEIP
jgi:hypothetical protein